jgi:membrane peptidoglycan carboxypeptidase
MQFITRSFYPNSVLFIFILFLTAGVSAEPVTSDASLKAETVRNIAGDDTTGEDLEIRRVAVEALGTAAGTIVVMNAQNGQILTIVNQKWAIENGFKPCSTIKLVTGIAGYNENLIKSDGALARGSYRIGLNDALAYSNNPYFQKVGANLGSEKMIYYARRLGLGEITGINAPNEYAGKLPYGNENLRIYSHADDFLVTPLQLSVMVSAITNGGKLLIPRIPRTSREKAGFRGAYRDNLQIDSNIYKRVIPGMKGAADYGTAGRIKNGDLQVAGKTGSCISQKTWVGLFASVAPVQNPKFSVVVITRGKYARGKYSAAIAEKVYRALRPRYNERFNTNLARQTITNRPVPKYPAETIADRKTEPETVEPQIKPKTVVNSVPAANNTVITYRRNAEDAAQPDPPRVEETQKDKPKELFPTVVIDGKTEITRPRVVGNQ